MADNYLERRMEELRSGKIAASVKPQRRPSGSSQAGKISLDFKPKRVLIIGDTSRLADALISTYRKAGCSVALLSTPSPEGERLAHDCGIRFCPCDLSDSDVFCRHFDNLLKAWRGLDIMVSVTQEGEEVLDSLLPLWQAYADSHPFPDDYGRRTLRISGRDGDPAEIATLALTAALPSIRHHQARILLSHDLLTLSFSLSSS